MPRVPDLGIQFAESFPPAVLCFACCTQGAALEAHQRFTAGQSIHTIATTGRAKPINPMTGTWSAH